MTTGQQDARVNDIQKIIRGIKLNTLRAINITRAEKIGEDKLKEMARTLGLNSTVNSLNFEGTQLGDKGVALLVDSLKSNPNIASINFQNCALAAEGARALASAISSTNHQQALATLNLSQNQLGPIGASHLTSLLKNSK